ncbi:MAG TPA: RsmG family class I SAM-dependent methyltransferase [Thermoleophilaceae bacterium]|jgi:16S rRNA (guanine527-N7)-methyltransferase
MRGELERALERHGQPAELAARFERLLGALAAEPDPHTTVFEPGEAARVHVADSLAGLAVPELREARSIADVGAGAGFPGLALAVALPHARADLIEAAGRKAAVIERLAAAAEADNARAVRARVEEWGAGEGREAYDAVTARAVGPLAVLAEYAAPLLSDGGVLVAWKGSRDAAEEGAGAVAGAQLGLEPRDVLPVEPYPGSRNRHLHVYRKVGPTPPGFPRRAGMAAKRPLA